MPADAGAEKAERERQAAALQAFRALLGNPGLKLADDLLDEVTRADIEETMRKILQFIEPYESVHVANPYSDDWRLSSPERRAERYGVPFLERVIMERKAVEAEAARQALTYRITFELPYAGAAQLAGCQGPEEIGGALAKAVAEIFEQWIYPPPEPPKPRQVTHSELLVAAAHADSPGAQFRRSVTEAHARLLQLPERDSHPGATLPGLATRP
jgi:hypothetical protein